MLSKVSVVSAANGSKVVHFIVTMARESTMDKMSEEKKIQGFPHVFYFWKF
jgi:hypothetical protein